MGNNPSAAQIDGTGTYTSNTAPTHIVIAGGPHSGSTTLYNHATFTFGDLTTNEFLEKNHKLHIYTQILQALQTLYNYSLFFGLLIPSHQQFVKDCNFFQAVDNSEAYGIFRQRGFALKLQSLWSDPTIQVTWKCRPSFFIDFQIEYYIQEMDRIADDDYQPTIQDILHGCYQFNHFNDKNVTIGNVPYQLYQIPLRELALYHQSTKQLLKTHVFTASSIGYCTIHSKHQRKIALAEDLRSFSEFIQCEDVTSNDYILVLTKFDLFQYFYLDFPLGNFVNLHQGCIPTSHHHSQDGEPQANPATSYPHAASPISSLPRSPSSYRASTKRESSRNSRSQKAHLLNNIVLNTTITAAEKGDSYPSSYTPSQASGSQAKEPFRPRKLSYGDLDFTSDVSADVPLTPQQASSVVFNQQLDSNVNDGDELSDIGCAHNPDSPNSTSNDQQRLSFDDDIVLRNSESLLDPRSVTAQSNTMSQQASEDSPYVNQLSQQLAAIRQASSQSTFDLYCHQQTVFGKSPHQLDDAEIMYSYSHPYYPYEMIFNAYRTILGTSPDTPLDACQRLHPTLLPSKSLLTGNFIDDSSPVTSPPQECPHQPSFTPASVENALDYIIRQFVDLVPPASLSRLHIRVIDTLDKYHIEQLFTDIHSIASHDDSLFVLGGASHVNNPTHSPNIYGCASVCIYTPNRSTHGDTSRGDTTHAVPGDDTTQQQNGTSRLTSMMCINGLRPNDQQRCLHLGAQVDTIQSKAVQCIDSALTHQKEAQQLESLSTVISTNISSIQQQINLLLLQKAYEEQHLELTRMHLDTIYTSMSLSHQRAYILLYKSLGLGKQLTTMFAQNILLDLSNTSDAPPSDATSTIQPMSISSAPLPVKAFPCQENRSGYALYKEMSAQQIIDLMDAEKARLWDLDQQQQEQSQQQPFSRRKSLFGRTPATPSRKLARQPSFTPFEEGVSSPPTGITTRPGSPSISTHATSLAQYRYELQQRGMPLKEIDKEVKRKQKEDIKRRDQEIQEQLRQAKLKEKLERERVKRLHRLPLYHTSSGLLVPPRGMVPAVEAIPEEPVDEQPCDMELPSVESTASTPVAPSVQATYSSTSMAVPVESPLTSDIHMLEMQQEEEYLMKRLAAIREAKEQFCLHRASHEQNQRTNIMVPDSQHQAVISRSALAHTSHFDLSEIDDARSAP